LTAQDTEEFKRTSASLNHLQPASATLHVLQARAPEIGIEKVGKIHLATGPNHSIARAVHGWPKSTTGSEHFLLAQLPNLSAELTGKYRMRIRVSML
jgi:hypothetical protein